MKDALVQIRTALLEDLPAIVEIYNSSIRGRKSVVETEPVTVESRLRWFHEHNATTLPLWVLEVDGNIIAWVSLQPYSQHPAFRKAAEVSVYVADEYQNQGYGTQLLTHMIAKCPELGVDVLMGVLFAHNEATIKMNRKLGLEQWGYLPQVAEMEGRSRDLIIMGIIISKYRKD